MNRISLHENKVLKLQNVVSLGMNMEVSKKVEKIYGQNEIVKATDSYRNNYFVHRNSNGNLWSEFLQSPGQRKYYDMHCIAVLLYVINNKLRVNCD